MRAGREGSLANDAITPHNDVLLIAVIDEATQAVVSICGTGFLVADRLLVTAWHCVRASLQAGQRYIACRKRGLDAYDAAEITDITQHPQGLDLALCVVQTEARERFSLFTGEVGAGMHVWTFGYPATQMAQGPDGKPIFHLGPRYLEGYTTREFIFERGPGGPSRVLELDMQVPGGLSGAPIFVQGRAAILGMIFQAHEVETVEVFASIDSITGERRPEIVRVIYFGLAYPIAPVLELKVPATGGRTLGELVSGGE